jgi:hypothetical protein
MAETHGSVHFYEQISDTPTFEQHDLAALARGYELLMEGLMHVAVQPVEVARSLISDGLVDLEALTRARGPAAFIEAEFEVLRRHSKRITDTARKLTDDMNQSWVDTCALFSHTPTRMWFDDRG